ncbi:MAG: GNAT family N-acetyltransferase [Candidatus Acidiferrum sp.]
MQVGDDGKLNWLGGTSRHFRHELRRFNRLLETEIGTKPELIRHGNLDTAIFNEFLSLEAAGWKGQEGSAIASKQETRAFYGELARAMTESGHFSFHSFQANGTMIAAAYGVFTDQCFYPMKITYKEVLHRCAPGHLMFNSIFEECSAKGIGTVYFGGARDPYKTKWTSDVQRNLCGVIFSSRLYPRLVYGMKTEIFPVLKKCRSFVLDNIPAIFKGKKDDQKNERTER